MINGNPKVLIDRSGEERPIFELKPGDYVLDVMSSKRVRIEHKLTRTISNAHRNFLELMPYSITLTNNIDGSDSSKIQVSPKQIVLLSERCGDFIETRIGQASHVGVAVRSPVDILSYTAMFLKCTAIIQLNGIPIVGLSASGQNIQKSPLSQKSIQL